MLFRDRARVAWRKSTFSGTTGGGCVEVARFDGRIVVRDSKDPHGPRLSFQPNEWDAFVGGVQSGEFNLCRLGFSWPR